MFCNPILFFTCSEVADCSHTLYMVKKVSFLLPLTCTVVWLHLPYRGSGDCSNTLVCQGSLKMVPVPPGLYSVWNFKEDDEVHRETLLYAFLSRFLNILSGLFPSSYHSVLVSTRAMIFNWYIAEFLMPSIISGRFSLDHFRPLIFWKW